MSVAAELGAKAVAFPAISTGVYGYPLELAAVRTVLEAPTNVDEVRFVLFGDEAYRAFERALEQAGGG